MQCVIWVKGIVWGIFFRRLGSESGRRANCQLELSPGLTRMPDARPLTVLICVDKLMELAERLEMDFDFRVA
jgi:hypothetical protein